MRTIDIQEDSSQLAQFWEIAGRDPAALDQAPTLTQSQYDEAMQLAVRRDWASVASFLIDKVTVFEWSGALVVAARMGHIECLTLLAQNCHPSISYPYREWGRVLCEACYHGQKDCASFLLPYCQKEDFEDAFYSALAADQLEVVKMLKPLCDASSVFADFCRENQGKTLERGKTIMATIWAEDEKDVLTQEVFKGIGQNNALAKNARKM